MAADGLGAGRPQRSHAAVQGDLDEQQGREGGRLRLDRMTGSREHTEVAVGDSP